MQIDIGQTGDSIVLTFHRQGHRINAYVLATTLVALTDAAREANRLVNPGYELEVVVEAFGPGSFRTRLRALYKSVDNLFSGAAVNNIIWGIVAAFIYEHTLAPDGKVIVNVNTDEVIIEQGDNRIIVPREIHEAKEALKKSEDFCSSVGKAMDTVGSEDGMTGFSMSAREDEPQAIITQEQCKAVALLTMDSPSRRYVDEMAELEIIRAILERSRRRWEFVWRGIRIAAPVTDEKFYMEFAAHEVTIAPGDILEARLRIYQRLDVAANTYINDGYEVIEVQGHRSRPKQQSL
jgi:predicted DCC family thiol-disulfide oxidoreductase YuxK